MAGFWDLGTWLSPSHRLKVSIYFQWYPGTLRLFWIQFFGTTTQLIFVLQNIKGFIKIGCYQYKSDWTRITFCFRLDKIKSTNKKVLYVHSSHRSSKQSCNIVAHFKHFLDYIYSYFIYCRYYVDLLWKKILWNKTCLSKTSILSKYVIFSSDKGYHQYCSQSCSEI